MRILLQLCGALAILLSIHAPLSSAQDVLDYPTLAAVNSTIVISADDLQIHPSLGPNPPSYLQLWGMFTAIQSQLSTVVVNLNTVNQRALNAESSLAAVLVAQVSTTNQRAIATETSLSSQLAIQVSTALAQLASEASRAQSTEVSLSATANIEVQRASLAEASLAVGISAATVFAQNNLAVSVANEVSRAVLTEVSLATKQGGLSAAVSQEAVRATGIEGSLAGSIASNSNAALAAVASSATAQTVALSQETARATSVEGALSGAVVAERVRAQTTEASLSVNALNLANALTQADAADAAAMAGVMGQIGAETSRAVAVEASLAAASNGFASLVQAEASRAVGAEASIYSSIVPPCPANSNGPAGRCTCNAGYNGTLTVSVGSYTGVCSPVACPPPSTGSTVVGGCTCPAGYSGSVTPTTSSPYYSYDCAAVNCPAGTSGTTIPTGCYCTACCSGGMSSVAVPSQSPPYYTMSACYSPTSCNTIYQSLPGAPSGTYTIDADGAGPVPPFDVYCDMSGVGGWTLVAVRSPGTVMFNEPAYAPLTTAYTPGRVSQVWSLTSTFAFQQIRYTNPQGNWAIVNFGSPTSLNNLNNLYSSYTLNAITGVTITSSVSALTTYYFRAQSGAYAPYSDSSDWAVMCFGESSINYGDAWDVGHYYWILSGTDNSYDPFTSSDCASGLVGGTSAYASCHWHTTCTNNFQTTTWVWFK